MFCGGEKVLCGVTAISPPWPWVCLKVEVDFMNSLDCMLKKLSGKPWVQMWLLEICCYC